MTHHHHHHHNERTFRAEDAHKLENPERLQWLPAGEILDRAGLKPGMKVADIGAGTGYFALPAAERVGASGRVFAVDLQPEMLKLLAAKLEGRSLPIDTLQGSADQTGLQDQSVDMVLLANVWHEVDDRAAALREARRVLLDGGRLVIVDWRADAAAPPGPPPEHRLGDDQVKHELGDQGWRVLASEHVGQFSYLVVASPV